MKYQVTFILDTDENDNIFGEDDNHVDPSDMEAVKDAVDETIGDTDLVVNKLEIKKV